MKQYNYGLFRQVINGEPILWAYGQYDCYSSLFIKVPGKGLTCVIAGNNSLMSDPARLIYGDVTTSLFALSFFENFVFDSMKQLDRNKLMAQAVAESFLGRYDSAHAETSRKLLRRLFEAYPDYEEYGNLTLLHNLSFLKAIDPTSDEFDPQLKTLGLKLLNDDPQNPYTNYYLADYYSVKNIDSARLFYKRISDAKNFSRNWYTDEADKWLKDNAK